MTAEQKTPQNWREVQLKELVFLQRGYDITKAQQKDGLIPVISSSGINSYHSESKVNGPGVIIGRKGSLGTVFYTETPYWPHDTTLWSKNLFHNNPKFVYHYMKTLRLENFDVGNSNPTLNRNHIHNLSIKIPDLKTQTRIAEVLSAYDDLIENNRRRIALLEESARLLYREWFVQLRFPGHENTPIKDGIPQGWERKVASEAIDILGGGTPNTKVPGYWSGNIPFFTPKDATKSFYCFSTEKKITEEGLRNCNSRLYPKDSIFLTARGTVGKINLTLFPMAMNQSCYALLSKPPLNQEYLYFTMLSKVEQIKGRAFGAVFDAITTNTFKVITLLIPPKEVLHYFNQHALPILLKIENLTKQNQQLAKARDLLLPKLMSGTLKV